MPAVTKNTLQEKEDKKSYGHKGELLAVRYLQRKKYDVLETNFRFGRGEIDIIAKDKDDKGCSSRLLVPEKSKGSFNSFRCDCCLLSITRRLLNSSHP